MVSFSDVMVVAHWHGAPLCGTVPADHLPAHREEVERIVPGARRDLLGGQNFMTGNYYSCFACQAACPLGGSGG